jgi:hypothetical protein
MNELQTYRQAAVDTAWHLCRHGIKIFPAIYGTKKPGLKWKQLATSDMNEFVKLVPPGKFNLALTFGPESNLIDIEPDDDAAVAKLAELMAENGCKTIAYKSRNGIHNLFRYEPRLAVFGKAVIKVGNLECRMGVGGYGSGEEDDADSRAAYSICPPSLHPDTKEHYLWMPGCAPWEADLAPMPENIINFFVTNYRAGGGGKSEVEVDAYEDGYLPGPGHRHEYLLKASKSFYTQWQLPRSLCEDMTRLLSQAIGSYELEGRGETEIKNLFNKLERPNDPLKELTIAVNMSDVDAVTEMVQVQRATTAAGHCQEIPTHIFHPLIEEASQNAKLAQYPRNLFLNTILCTTAHTLGQAVKVRVSEDHDPTGLQLFSFGVGGSGTGKSKTIKALLGPVSHSDSVTTEGSPEGLVSLMSRFPRGVMIELTEGKEFFKMLGKYSSQPGQGSDNSLFHKCWSGDKIKRTLQKGTFGCQEPFLVVCAAIQKINLNQMPPGDCLDGLLQRMLIMPIGDVPRKTDPMALSLFQQFLRTWYEIVGRLETVKPAIGQPVLSSMITGSGVAIRPLTLTLDKHAREMWNDYASDKRSPQTMGAWPEDHPYRADVVRHAEMGLRLAGSLFMQDCACDKAFWEHHQVGNQDNGWLPEAVMKRGIDYMEHAWYQKQKLVDPIVESAFASASGLHMLQREESVVSRVDKHIAARRRRIEQAFGEEWTHREYYTVFKLKKEEARRELDLFIREGHIVELGLVDGKKSVRYKFLGEVE